MSTYALRTFLPLVPPSTLRADCSCTGFSFPKKPNHHQYTALMHQLYLICLPGISSTSVIAPIQLNTENSQERARHVIDMAWGSHGNHTLPSATWVALSSRNLTGYCNTVQGRKIYVHKHSHQRPPASTVTCPKWIRFGQNAGVWEAV